jgi:hypothetical protein
VVKTPPPLSGLRVAEFLIWRRTMGDVDGPEVARTLYDGLFSKEKLDLEDVPYLLDDAIQGLRERSPKAFHRWATFIHTGA